MLQITIVRETKLRIKVKSDFYVFIFHLQGLGKSCQCPERSLREVLGLLVPREPQQSLAQLGGQNCRQGAVFGCFYAQGMNASPFSVIHHSIQ